MVEAHTIGGHVPEESLSLHFAGALTPVESDAIHGHLQQCPACQENADRICDLIVSLTLLTGDDGGTPEPSVPVIAAAPPAPSRPSLNRPTSTRPAGSSRAGRPARGSRRPGRAGKVFHASLLLVLALSLAGLGVAALVHEPPAGPGTSAVTAAADSADADTGATLAVTVTGQPDGTGSAVRATVTGLASGDWYMLFAIAADGQTHIVKEWTATPAVQTVSAKLDVGVDDLRQFIVTERNGTPVVSANLSTGAPGRVLTR